MYRVLSEIYCIFPIVSRLPIALINVQKNLSLISVKAWRNLLRCYHFLTWTGYQ